MQYKFSKGLKKGFFALVIFAIPFLITNFPEIANLTLGAVGLMIVNFIKIKMK